MHSGVHVVSYMSLRWVNLWKWGGFMMGISWLPYLMFFILGMTNQTDKDAQESVSRPSELVKRCHLLSPIIYLHKESLQCLGLDWTFLPLPLFLSHVCLDVLCFFYITMLRCKEKM